ncbi:MAG: CopG family transcriptional regulator [Candidatus Aureabacteria bacterium]|nr:CopG family transcriptional regulator [Candidatus Auribacterota bacterium]
MKKATIKIPKTLYDSLKDKIKGTGFSSVTDFIIYVMRDIAAGSSLHEEASLTKKEINQIRKRLKTLGYLD